MRTTYSSKLYADHIPKKSDIVVQTIEKNGGLIIGKTNIPEFAAGSHTYNSIGLTKNPEYIIRWRKFWRAAAA